MKSKYVCIALVLSSLLLIVWPQQRAEATVISMYCTNNATYAGLFAPRPNVGCIVFWYPGGLGNRGTFSGEFPTCTPNCVVVPGEWNMGLPFSISNGSRDKQIGTNCLGVIATVGVAALGIVTSRSRTNPVPQIIFRSAQGSVGIWCPSGQVGSIGDGN